MINRQRGPLSRALLAGASACAIAAAAPAFAQETTATRAFDIPAQPLSSALMAYSRQADTPVIASMELLTGKTAPAVRGDLPQQVALSMLLEGSGLRAVQGPSGGIVVERVSQDPQGGSAAGGGATVEALIVTAQKREEDIQDVPIAISAFTQEDLDRSQVAGGPDLMTQVPNMTFTKTNFTSYSIQLRGIGTQAISATVDHAVAVAFNNTPFIRNRFFEQEFYDLQRVEVLRGPQGTLYGRNATAGVVNLISQKPKFLYEARLSGDVANYNSTRLEGMLNVPLVEDIAALRLAGAWTKRDGYAVNEITGNPIDGRDLWSTRLSLRFAPTDRLDVNLIWEHFEENDDRIRSGKQLCKAHEVTSLTAIFPDGSVQEFETTHEQLLPDAGQPTPLQGTFSQGCEPASLYDPDSFQKPNGYSLPYYEALSNVALPAALNDPYTSRTQSRDLRVIESVVDPSYRAKADVFELQASYDLTDSLTVTSETGYSSDFIFSTQDYNRFNTASGAWDASPNNEGFNPWVDQGILSPDGFFCDPQIGCSDRLVAVDLSTAESRHFSQELRLSSSYDGPFNFSLGANFLRYDTEDKYYVFINSLTIFAASEDGSGAFPYEAGVSDNRLCMLRGIEPPDINEGGILGNGCLYIDPNPIDSLNDLGRNYFLSRNPYKLISYAVFGESYYNITDALKLTAGLRWTVDKKEAPRIPSWLLAGKSIGLPVVEVVEQEWREPTGRLTLDWKPDLAFTDETMVYASYARGYKAGGMNPPAAALVCYAGCGNYVEDWLARSAVKPKSFDAEFVDAFELGSKNTLLDGRVTLNTAAFYYDYRGYQLSQIVDRAAITQNYDATVWGLEFEADWRPIENLRLGLKGGYEETKVADGMRAIDVMDRTAGTPGWIVVSPFPAFPSNCVMPAYVYAGIAGFFNGSTVVFPGGPNLPHGTPIPINVGFPGGGGEGGCELAYLYGVDPVTRLPYVENPTVTLDGNALASRPGYPGWNPLDESEFQHNSGEGFFKELAGNELPNAPNFTATITADYTVPLPRDWLMTLHTDLYYQSEAWWRIFNTPGYDKLKAYTNVNLAAIFTNEEAGWKVMAYVKNVFDNDHITGAFLNSDDTGLTTNVFLIEPRLYGLRVTKEWTGGPWWTGADPSASGPFPLTVEIGGQIQRQEAPYEEIQSQAFNTLHESLWSLGEAQGQDLDWGDGRSVRLTWRPAGSSWNVSAGVRYGRANRDLSRGRGEHTEYIEACVAGDPFLAFLFCNPAGPVYNPAFATFPGPSYTDTTGWDREEHTIVDFEVGHEVGLGSMFGASEVGVGLRHAQFESLTVLRGDGRSNWFVTDGWGIAPLSPITVSQYDVDLTATRTFEGVGPTLRWDASIPLLGDERTGRLGLEWSAAGGVLFGKQEASLTGNDLAQVTRGFYNDTGDTWPLPPLGDPVVFDQPEARSQDVTVPLVDLSLGLAYEVGRVKVGTGYRWERYFDVLDVGYDEEKSADRTIDGPYFKLAIGFGG